MHCARFANEFQRGAYILDLFQSNFGPNLAILQTSGRKQDLRRYLMTSHRVVFFPVQFLSYRDHHRIHSLQCFQKDRRTKLGDHFY